MQQEKQKENYKNSHACLTRHYCGNNISCDNVNKYSDNLIPCNMISQMQIVQFHEKSYKALLSS